MCTSSNLRLVSGSDHLLHLPPESFPVIDRRSFLRVASSTAAALPIVRFDVADAADRRVPLNAYPFQLGVASGDPSSSGVVLWTRLVTDPLNGGGMPPESIQVEWQVCDDEAMTKVVQKGTATASPEWAHSVHVEVEGLKPDRGYFYQFKVGSDVSPIGRTRTAPTADTMLDRFRFAFASCQHWEMGFYNAYQHMAKEDLRLVVHLGDYIYEKKAGKKGHVRLHNGDELESLDDYRNRHALYKTDENLRAAHQAFPWLLTWDDHEFDNNYAGATSEQADIDPSAFLRRRANAYKATTNICRCGVPACRKVPTCESIARFPSDNWSSSICSTRGNIARTNPAATSESHSAKVATIPKRPCWASGKSVG